MRMKRMKCRSCGKPANRIVSHVSLDPNQPKHKWWHIFARFKRHRLDAGVYMQEPSCVDCMLEGNHGLLAFICKECKFKFYIEYDYLMDTYYADERMSTGCPICGGFAPAIDEQESSEPLKWDTIKGKKVIK